MLVAHPTLGNTDLLTIPQIPKLPEYKHLSLRQMKVHYKRVKKVKMIRKFTKKTSVFHNWNVCTPKMIDKAFSLDQ